jgi:hypothetical protein
MDLTGMTVSCESDDFVPYGEEQLKNMAVMIGS